MAHTSEKRSSDRKRFNHSVSVEFSCMDAGKITNGQISGAGIDISPSGVGLTTGHKLVDGEVVRLYLPLEDLDVSMPVYSEVKWSKPAKGCFRAGLRFLV